MRKSIIISILSILIAQVYVNMSYCQEVYTSKDGYVRGMDVKALMLKTNSMYMATKSILYRTSGSKDIWESIFSLPPGENEITCLASKSDDLYIGTKRGLYRSRDRPYSWTKVFRTIIPEKSDVLCINTYSGEDGTIYIGTEKGIFISRDYGDKWSDISGVLKNRPVRYIALAKGYIFSGSDDGLYTSDDGLTNGWKRVIVRGAVQEQEGDINTGYIENIEEEPTITPSCVAIGSNRIYAGLGKKIVYSEDDGKSWRDFTREGLTGAVNSILPSSRADMLYCATTKGVFGYGQDKSRWAELYKGSDKRTNAKDITFTDELEHALWAVTDRGLYRFQTDKYMMDQYLDIERNIKSFKLTNGMEPSFRELQQAAIRYAEVSPDKIRRWRQDAKMRALMPKVSLGMDRNRSTNTEIYTSATKDYSVVGPDDISGGWDLSLSWELGDIIWSDDQTNIDVRSKLMVQLRIDILDDLRRVYYERKHLQFELAAESPKDIKARIEKEMRLEELTQAIDDLTGNYFSDKTIKHN